MSVHCVFMFSVKLVSRRMDSFALFSHRHTCLLVAVATGSISSLRIGRERFLMANLASPPYLKLLPIYTDISLMVFVKRSNCLSSEQLVAKLAFGGPLERHCCHVLKIPGFSLFFLSIFSEDADDYEGTKQAYKPSQWTHKELLLAWGGTCFCFLNFFQKHEHFQIPHLHFSCHLQTFLITTNITLFYKPFRMCVC